MRITEIFALGHYDRSDDCYHGGHYDRYGHGDGYRHGGYHDGGYGARRYDDRDTPLAQLRGSRL
ncbi:MAG: hypothetical protein ACRDSZ_17460 [Pseudonocardiaceae bacterium]